MITKPHYRYVILQIEDDILTSRTQAALLGSEGYEVLTAGSGEEALIILDTHNPDLVLMDIDLGGDRMNGVETAKRILVKNPLPIVFITGHTEKEYADRVRGIPRYGYVVKSSGTFVLIQAVEMALELHEKEKELRKQKDLLEATFSSIQEGISILDQQLTIQHVNTVMESWYPESLPLLGKKCYEAYHKRTGPCKICPSLRALKSGILESDTVQARSGGPKSKWLEVFSYPIRIAGNGRFSGVVEFVRDITERKCTEDALKEAEARWKFALEGAGDGVWDWNAQTNRVYFSSQWKKMLGFKEDEIGESLSEWSELLHPEDKERCHIDLQDHLDGKTPYYRNEHRIRCKDGMYKWILDRGKVVERTEDGKPLRVIGTHADITERKTMEEKASDLLEEKEQLLKEMNHRIKNNLSLVSSLLHLKHESLKGKADLTDVEHQIDAIRIVHEKLQNLDDITSIPFKEYVEDLLVTIFSSFTSCLISYRVMSEHFQLPTKIMVPLGLITNELAMNTMKYGFPGRRADNSKGSIPPNDTCKGVGDFSVNLKKDASQEEYILVISNNGPPFPEDVDIHNPESLGLGLVVALADQINASLELKRTPHPEFIFRFSLK